MTEPLDPNNFFEQAYEAIRIREHAISHHHEAYVQLLDRYDRLLNQYKVLGQLYIELQGQYEAINPGAEVRVARPTVADVKVYFRPSLPDSLIREEAGQGLDGPDPGAAGPDHEGPSETPQTYDPGNRG